MDPRAAARGYWSAQRRTGEEPVSQPRRYSSWLAKRMGREDVEKAASSSSTPSSCILDSRSAPTPHPSAPPPALRARPPPFLACSNPSKGYTLIVPKRSPRRSRNSEPSGRDASGEGALQSDPSALSVTLKNRMETCRTRRAPMPHTSFRVGGGGQWEWDRGSRVIKLVFCALEA